MDNHVERGARQIAICAKQCVARIPPLLPNIIGIITVYRDRLEKGEFHMLVRNLRLHDHEYFFSCFCVSPLTFEELLSFVVPIIAKKITVSKIQVSDWLLP